MTDKELKRMSRGELLELLLFQMEENEKLQKELKEAREELENRRIIIRLEDAEFVLYRKTTGGKEEYAIWDNEGKLEGWTENYLTEDGDYYVEMENGEVLGNVVVSSNKDGEIDFKGLESATYYLKEVKAPDGYNQLTKDIEIQLKVEYNADNTIKEIYTYKDGSKWSGIISTGAIDVTVYNNKGAQLPGTGGIGTTIFYTVGGILVAAAGILLITRKRMSVEE